MPCPPMMPQFPQQLPCAPQMPMMQQQMPCMPQQNFMMPPQFPMQQSFQHPCLQSMGGSFAGSQMMLPQGGMSNYLGYGSPSYPGSNMNMMGGFPSTGRVLVMASKNFRSKFYCRCFCVFSILLSFLVNETCSKSVRVHAHGQRLSIPRYPYIKDRIIRSNSGKLLSVDTNGIHRPNNAIEIEQELSLTTQTLPLFDFETQHTCVTACYACVEGPLHSEGSNKKQSSDENCGPMCDCADMCFTNSIEEVNSQFGGENSCWLRSYLQALAGEQVI
ncbi:unnamed protein product [Didymodactylos carnosus]|uniref:Uncharacterized protein n=1 Tax=Didymodactylos carnosus TaxID=1234261 RepID=A0A814MFC7_9BILA|nr:unnamed protein product [Didymodactylos carnosus]CAF3842260.1 unnamed protein product [Didymodactylos carnosus]